MDRIEAMQIFVRVAEAASFTRAADNLALPKASVSTAVQQLETSLGTRLLHRTTRRVEMTQDGRVYYEHCKDLLADFDELQAMFQQGPQALRGRLRADMPIAIARNIIIPQLPKFLQLHPQLEVELSTTDRRVDLVREGFDCVLRIGGLGDANLVARPIGRMTQLNCASPAYLRTHGTPQTLDDLASHHLIHFVQTIGAKASGFEYPEAGSYKTLAMKGVITVNNTDAYQVACLAGLGLIQAPAMGVQHHLLQGTLVEVLPQFRAESMPVTLLYAHRRNLSRRVQAFMNWVAETLKPHLDEAV